MASPKPEPESKSAIRRGFLLGVVFVLVALLLGFGFFMAGHHYATCYAPTFDQSNTAAGDRYIAQVTDFYKSIISIQFAVIGVVLAVAFVYVHTVSRQQARDIATEALDSPSFQRDLDHRLKDVETKLGDSLNAKWINVKNESEFADLLANQEEILESQKKLLTRVTFVEQVMNAYTASEKKTGLTLQESQAEHKG